MTMQRSGFTSAVVSAVSLLSGCSAPSLPSLPDIAEALSPYPVVGPPTDIYARIARGALGCWFGQSGPLKAAYVYHAEADPPSKGGKATIVIHERDPNSANPRGPRAYQVLITPDGDASALTVENLSLPAPLAQSMEADVRRWAAGGIGCTGANDGGWSPGPPRPPEELDRQPGARPKPAPKGRSA